MKSDEMDNRTVLISGATAGIGRVTARELADRGATVVFIARNAQKAAVTKTWITGETGNPNVHYLLADFSSLTQVRAVAEEFTRSHGRLDVLVNNAGAIFFRRTLSEDGFEMTFAVNHLAPFLLTNLLLPLLTESPSGRVVTVSSRAHVAAKIDFDDLQLEQRYGAMRAYSRSKLANLLFTYELARRLEGTAVTANALHPGFVASEFGKNNGLLVRLLLPFAMLFGRAVDVGEGASTSVYLASAPEVASLSGRYFVDCREASSSKVSHDVAAMIKLWELSSRMTGLPVSV